MSGTNPMTQDALKDGFSEGDDRTIEAQIQELEARLQELRAQLSSNDKSEDMRQTSVGQDSEKGNKTKTNQEFYRRYGRQMILPQVGPEGQMLFRHARVLIIGLGGLGCPAALYLAGAGIGTIGLMDGDVVDLSNLHRQILHTVDRIGMNKAHSARIGLQAVNPTVSYHVHQGAFTTANAVDIIEKNRYNLILDCTDSPSTRYLISDAAVVLNVALISAAALRTDGQLLVLNHPPSLASDPDVGGHCYRCVHPQPPPPKALMTCGEAGIFGPTVGVMGILMASEAMKVLLSSSEQAASSSDFRYMILSSLLIGPLTRKVRLKGKRADCIACGPFRRITRESIGAMDPLGYAHSSCRNDKESSALGSRISTNEMRQLLNSRRNILMIDVRSEVEYKIGKIDNSLNVPMAAIEADPNKALGKISSMALDITANGSNAYRPLILFFCKNGNDSQQARLLFQEYGSGKSKKDSVSCLDLEGGLQRWRQDIDPDFPDY